MKIYLDLLPAERKEEIKKKKAFKTLIHQEIRLFIPVIFFTAVLLAINFNLKIQLNGLEKSSSIEQSQDEYQELKSYEEKFSDINSKVSAVSNFQSKHLYWSSAFEELSKVIPDGAHITNLATKDYKISLAGKAKTRDDLLAFQERIKSSDCFANVNVPLPNLVSKENVVFQVDLEVKSNCLQKNK